MPKIETLKRSILYMDRLERIELVRETRRRREAYVPPKKPSTAKGGTKAKRKTTGSRAKKSKGITPQQAAKLLDAIRKAEGK